MLGRIANRLLRPFGYRLTPDEFDDRSQGLTDEERDLLGRVRPFTMTSPEQMLALMDAVKYVSNGAIPGAIVECGVWRGGSMMLAAELLSSLGSTERDLYLYDAFTGMPPSSADDVRFDGLTTEEVKTMEGIKGGWCLATRQEVTENLRTTAYPSERIHIVEGYVEQTIPAESPDDIAILRLDTDWYTSTKHGLVHLYPRLSSGGVLILDDYGYWKGAQKAVDEYFAEFGGNRPLLQRTDRYGRIAIKR
jgi:O-methyltransferase